MNHKRQGRRRSGRLAVILAALTAALMLTMPVAAATCTASDVMIRNTGEEKDGNIIGVLNEGDKVTVKSKSTDASGIEWYFVELPNGNTGYVKAQWIDNGGEDVETVEAEAAPAEAEAEEEETGTELEGEQAGDDDFLPEDDWTAEDSDDAGDVPVAEDAAADEAAEGVADGQEKPEVDDGSAYDPYTDPNAQYSINFVTEKDGTGNWYIYNYDTDKRIRIGDLEKLSDTETAAQKSASSAGIWRMIACILLLLLVAVLIIFYLLLRRNGSDGSDSPASRRAQRRRSRAYEGEYDGEEDDEEYPFVEEDPEDRAAEDDSLPEAGTDEADRRIDRQTALSREAASQAVISDETEPEEEAAGEEDEDEENERPARRRGFGLFGKGRRSDEVFFEEDEEDDGYTDEDDEDYGEDDDADYEDEDEEDMPRRGGLFGVLRNIFSSNGLEDDYDEDEDEDYDEDEDDQEDDFDEEEEAPVRSRRRQTGRSARKDPEPRPRRRPSRTIEFDEAADYPEDADLLNAGKPADPDASSVTVELPSGKAADKSGAFIPAADLPQEEDTVDEDFFADDDDDMEYSFLNSSSRRGSRK